MKYLEGTHYSLVLPSVKLALTGDLIFKYLYFQAIIHNFLNTNVYHYYILQNATSPLDWLDDVHLSLCRHINIKGKPGKVK